MEPELATRMDLNMRHLVFIICFIRIDRLRVASERGLSKKLCGFGTAEFGAEWWDGMQLAQMVLPVLQTE